MGWDCARTEDLIGVFVVDSHVHIYSPDQWAFPARPDARRPRPGIGTLRDFEQQCATNGISRGVAIQTVSMYGWDTRYTAYLARTEPDRLAVVCAVDPEDPRSVDHLTELVTRDGVRGLRILTISSGQLDVPEVRSLFARAGDLGIVVNVLCSVAHDDELDQLLEAYPSIPVVIEHALSLNRSTDLDGSVAVLTRLARWHNAVVELCDLPAISKRAYPFDDQHDLFSQIIEVFGPDRCVWGSCYPVEFWVPRTNQRESLDVFLKELALDSDSRASILGGTARRLWFSNALNSTVG
jgi:predicted TIM-barrel fold metal-dependent hydrolase